MISPGQRPSLTNSRNKKTQSFIEPKKLSASNFSLDEESESDDIPVFSRGHKKMFTQLEAYLNELASNQTTFFLNALAVYSECKLEEQTETSESGEFFIK